MDAIPSSHEDLLRQDVAVLATVGPDGRPQCSAIWFLHEGDEVATSLSSARQKTRNLLANRACCLFILDRANPQRYLELRGDAVLEPDEEYAFADRLGAKYGFDLRTLDQPGDHRYLARFQPVRVNAVDLSA
jgi:PPOX class probable F420-dependent enzyme